MGEKPVKTEDDGDCRCQLSSDFVVVAVVPIPVPCAVLSAYRGEE